MPILNDRLTPVSVVRTVSLDLEFALLAFAPTLLTAPPPTPIDAPMLNDFDFSVSCTLSTFRFLVFRFSSSLAAMFAPTMFVVSFTLKFMLFALRLEFVWVVVRLKS